MNHQDSNEKFRREDEGDVEHRRYAPRWVREQATPAPEQPYINSAPISRATGRLAREWPPISDFNSSPQRIPEPPVRLDDEPRSVIARVALFVSVAAFIALVIIFAKPLSQFASGFFGSYSESADVKTDRASPRNAAAEQPSQANRASVPAKAITVVAGGNTSVAGPPQSSAGTQSQQSGAQQPAPSNPAQPVAQELRRSNNLAPGVIDVAAAGNTPLAGPPQSSAGTQSQQPGQQQAALSNPTQPIAQESQPSKTVIRGVTDSEIRFGISAPFSGAAKELGQNMRLGIEAAFNAANDGGGIFGRRLRLIAADDGYEPSRTGVTMKTLFEKEQVFGILGNVGTPTAVVALPYALERKMLFFGAFTGAGLLRNDPPDRYVFNYRSSYAEETSAVVHYLVKVRHLRPNQIAVFAQQDSYGDSGFAGVAKAIRSLGGAESAVLRLNYTRNTVDVDEAVEQLRKSRIPIRAVIMVPTYRAAAKFIEKTRDLYPNMIYTSVSFVGSTALANELMLLGRRFANGVIVTQVVPAVDGHSSLVLEYKSMR